MDLMRILEVCWARKWVLVGACVVGGVLAFLSVSRGGSKTEYETSAEIILEEPQFGLGSLDVNPTRPDPGRLIGLALTYARLLESDLVVRRVQEAVGPTNTRVSTSPISGTPIIEVNVSGDNGRDVRRVAAATAEEFIDYVAERQEESKIEPRDRVMVHWLRRPGVANQVRSRTAEMALLAFLAPVALGLAAALALENLRRGVTERGHRAVHETPPAGHASPGAPSAQRFPQHTSTTPQAQGVVARPAVPRVEKRDGAPMQVRSPVQ